MRTAFINELCRIASRNENVWLLCGDLGFSVLEKFACDFSERYLNAGVAEQNMSGVAAGLALCGKTVFTYSIANFPTARCLEQIRNDICYHCADVKIVAIGGGFTYGAHGYTHHGLEDLALMRALPGMTVVAPGDPVEAGLATRAVMDVRGPCYLRLGKAGDPRVHDSEPEFEIGKAIRLKEGGDISLISTGSMLQNTILAAEELEKKGIKAAVLSMHTLKPLDREAVLEEAGRTGAIITLEEHSETGGIGSAVAEVLAGVNGVKFRSIAVPSDVSSVIGSQQYLRKHYGLDVTSIVERASALTGSV